MIDRYVHALKFLISRNAILVAEFVILGDVYQVSGSLRNESSVNVS